MTNEVYVGKGEDDVCWQTGTHNLHTCDVIDPNMNPKIRFDCTLKPLKDQGFLSNKNCVYFNHGLAVNGRRKC